MKKRLITVTGIIIIVAIVLFTLIGGQTAAKTVTVAQMKDIPTGQKVQVSGNVLPESFTTNVHGLTFKIYDPDDASATPLEVYYDGVASSTFGNDVTAICMGKKDNDGVLQCSELVTKCPSKYDSSESTISVNQLLNYGEKIIGKPVKINGVIVGAVEPVTSNVRFTLQDPKDKDVKLSVVYENALSDEIKEGSAVVVTGSLDNTGAFNTTNVALEK